MQLRLLQFLLVLIGIMLVAGVIAGWRMRSQYEPEPAELEYEKRISRPAQLTMPEATDLQRKMAAVVLGEAWPGQEEDIRWIYWNNVNMLGPEKGLLKSSIYKRKGAWYQCWMHLLGDHSYDDYPLPENERFQGLTVKQYCQNEYMRNQAFKRARKVLLGVKEMFESDVANPYPGWIGQGNIGDFNHDEDYWKRSRQYFWLQESGQVDEKRVELLEAGKFTQFVFDGNGIRDFALEHPELFPDEVPEYTIPRPAPMAGN